MDLESLVSQLPPFFIEHKGAVYPLACPAQIEAIILMKGTQKCFVFASRKSSSLVLILR